MTNSHEPSYYEIALTNRQVVVAFVILLVCLVSAFFAGLWIGRESAVRAQDQMVRNSPPAPAEPQDGQALEEFRFFEDDQHTGSTPGQTPPKETPRPAQATSTPEETTLVEDLGGAQEEPAADPDLPEGRRHRGGGGRGGRDAAGTEGDESAPATPASSPVPSPTPARPQRSTPVSTPVSTPASTPAKTPASSEPKIAAGQLVIQVFSTADADQAESVRARLVKGGQKAFLSPVKVGGRTMYRVRIGPFDTRDQAQKVAEQVRKGYKLDTWVTE